VDPAGADLLAAELSQRATASRRSPAGRSGTGTRATRGSASRGAEPQERANKPSRSGGLLRRVLGFGLPVAAFAAAFILGAASRPHHPAPAHLATASSRTAASATVSKVSPVPAPAKLIVAKHRAVHKSKPKPANRTAVATHGTTTARPTASDPPASPAPAAPAAPAPTITPGSGGSSVSTNGTGTASGTG
jgi:hypothetical protein